MIDKLGMHFDTLAHQPRRTAEPHFAGASAHQSSLQEARVTLHVFAK